MKKQKNSSEKYPPLKRSTRYELIEDESSEAEKHQRGEEVYYGRG